jgi:hypothetical protein
MHLLTVFAKEPTESVLRAEWQMSDKSPEKDKKATQGALPVDGADTSSNASPAADTAELDILLAKIKSDRESIAAAKAEADENTSAIKAARTALGTDLTSLTELKSKVTGLINGAEKDAKQISLEQESLNAQLIELKNSQKELRELLQSSGKFKGEFESDNAAIDSVKLAVTQTKSDFDDLAGKAQQSHTSLMAQQGGATQSAEQVNKLLEQTKQQYDILFSDESDANGTITKKSVNTKITELYAAATKKLDATQINLKEINDKLATLESSSVEEIKQIKDEANQALKAQLETNDTEIKNQLRTLREKIESLLPGAGAAGLASTYFDAKARYGFTPLRITPDMKYPKWDRAVHYFKMLAVNLSYYALFLAPLIVIAVMFSHIINGIIKGGSDVSSGTTVLALRFLITIPLGFISAFGFASIRLNRQMYEEYNQKQRVIELYYSFKKEVNEVGEDNHKQLLLTIMLNAVGSKPDLGMEDFGVKEMFNSLISKLPDISFGSKDTPPK